MHATARGRLRPADSESVAAYIDRVAGRSATRWLVGPALQGIYAAPPDRLAARDPQRSGRGEVIMQELLGKSSWSSMN